MIESVDPLENRRKEEKKSQKENSKVSPQRHAALPMTQSLDRASRRGSTRSASPRKLSARAQLALYTLVILQRPRMSFEPTLVDIAFLGRPGSRNGMLVYRTPARVLGKPSRNAVLVEPAETFQSCHGIPNLKLLQADCALCTVYTILLCSDVWEHACPPGCHAGALTTGGSVSTVGRDAYVDMRLS